MKTKLKLFLSSKYKLAHVAEYLEVSQPHLSNMLSGRATISPEHREKLIELGATPEHFEGVKWVAQN